MKYLIVISVILTSMNAFSQNHNQDSSTIDLQSKYFPIQLGGVYINMKFEDLLQQRPAIQRDDVSSGDNLGYYDEYFDEVKL